MEKKLLDFDWQRAVQFKCNTSAKSVLPVQKTQRYSNYNRLKENIIFPRLMISRNVR